MQKPKPYPWERGECYGIVTQDAASKASNFGCHSKLPPRLFQIIGTTQTTRAKSSPLWRTARLCAMVLSTTQGE